jgi:hypothetical protein
VMGAVPAADQGMASGTNNAIRELGGVLGIAVLATVFASHGSYASPATFADGLRPATWVGAAVVGAGALAAAAIPTRRRAVEVTLEVAPRQPPVFQLDAESADAAAALERAGQFLATRLRSEKEEV